MVFARLCRHDVVYLRAFRTKRWSDTFILRIYYGISAIGKCACTMHIDYNRDRVDDIKVIRWGYKHTDCTIREVVHSPDGLVAFSSVVTVTG